MVPKGCRRTLFNTNVPNALDALGKILNKYQRLNWEKLNDPDVRYGKAMHITRGR